MSRPADPRGQPITVVSGLPRSGTSMMMRMLEAGGLELLSDGTRAADADNPRGYYEYERVKRLEIDASWLGEARGKALKIVSALLRHLPAGLRYKILFMQRDLSEVLASQRVMLVRRGKATSPAEDARMADLFDKHLREVERVLAARTDVEVLYVRYDAVLRDAHRVARDVATFLGAGLDAERMAAAVEPALYRQRSDLEPRE